tara:strand:- start:46 stop:678 length:633 start_codon:yes stop_codon:yes gene_type:complete
MIFFNKYIKSFWYLIIVLSTSCESYKLDCDCDSISKEQFPINEVEGDPLFAKALEAIFKEIIIPGQDPIYRDIMINHGGGKMRLEGQKDKWISIPEGTILKVLDKSETFTPMYSMDYQVEYENNLGWIPYGYTHNNVRATALNWMREEICESKHIMIYKIGKPVIKDGHWLMNIGFWRRCDSGLYIKEDKTFKIKDQIVLEVIENEFLND